MYICIGNYIGTKVGDLPAVLVLWAPGGEWCRLFWAGGPGVVLILCGIVVFAMGRFCVGSFLALCYHVVSVLLKLWSPSLWRRELAYVLLVHLFVYFACVNFCPFSLPLGIGVWLRLVVVALIGLFDELFTFVMDEHHLFLHFFFSPKFRHLKFSSHFSQKL